MAVIVNLNRVRKQKRREEEKREAAVNRVAFGRSKEERCLQESQREHTKRGLDNKQLD